MLEQGGLLMFSMLGPDSLRELRDAWSEADPGAWHVKRFIERAKAADLGLDQSDVMKNVVAAFNSTPLWWDGTEGGLPIGWDDQFERAVT